MLVAREIRPDYLSVQTEPDTDARDVRNAAVASAINNPASDGAMVRRFVADLEEAQVPGLHTSTRVGAGVGPWLPNWRAYVDAFLDIPGLDEIETHIYNLEPSLDEVNRVLDVFLAYQASAPR